MAEMHLKKCSKSLVIREIQIITLKFHLITIRMAKIKSQEIVHAADNVEQGTLLHCWWECNLVHTLLKSIWYILRKLRIVLLQDPDIPFLGIYPKDTLTSHKGSCLTIFIAALFEIARKWKQLRYPSTEEWIKKIL